MDPLPSVIIMLIVTTGIEESGKEKEDVGGISFRVETCSGCSVRVLSNRRIRDQLVQSVQEQSIRDSTLMPYPPLLSELLFLCLNSFGRRRILIIIQESGTERINRHSNLSLSSSRLITQTLSFSSCQSILFSLSLRMMLWISSSIHGLFLESAVRFGRFIRVSPLF